MTRYEKGPTETELLGQSRGRNLSRWSCRCCRIRIPTAVHEVLHCATHAGRLAPRPKTKVTRRQTQSIGAAARLSRRNSSRKRARIVTA